MGMARAIQFESLLDSTDSERPLLSWLKKHPLLLTQTFQFGDRVTSEFPFGSDFRADFVVLGPFSGGFDVHFIELEPPNAPLFTKAGNHARRLAQAVTQVDNWRQFIEKNRDCVTRELSKFFKKRELVWKRHTIPMDNCRWPLTHPQVQLLWQFHIVIGRRAKLSEDQIERKSFFYNNHRITILTYDRLLDAAKRLDAADAERRAAFKRYKKEKSAGL